MQPKDYKDNFFEYHVEGALKSAKSVIPVVLEYVRPSSVIDVGCGIGAWLSIWEQNGIKDIFGIDGDYVDTSKLLIEKSGFKAANLEEGYKSDKQYGLVSCLEVAEHLKPEYAGRFIQSLCGLGDLILFSAAIPGQEGTMHVNEQYPDYWVSLFKENGFVPVDCLRERIWNNKEIQWWYRQNVMFFVKEKSIANYSTLSNAISAKGKSVLSLVHPEAFADKTRKLDYYKQVLMSPVSALKYFLKK